MKLVSEHINEKFTEDSDPIHDMGIGFNKEKLKKLRYEIGNMTSERIHKKYFSKEVKENEEFLMKYDIGFRLYYIFKFMDEYRIFPQEAFEKMIKQEYHNREFEEIKEIKKVFKKVLKREFGYGIDINESVNEVFTQDSDPIHDLGIGMYSIQIPMPSISRKRISNPYILDKSKENNIKYKIVDAVHSGQSGRIAYYTLFVKFIGTKENLLKLREELYQKSIISTYWYVEWKRNMKLLKKV